MYMFFINNKSAFLKCIFNIRLNHLLNIIVNLFMQTYGSVWLCFVLRFENGNLVNNGIYYFVQSRLFYRFSSKFN